MTSCQDIGISFMSPVLKKLLPIKKVCSPKLDENTFQEEISAHSLWIQKIKMEVFNLVMEQYEPYRHGQLTIMGQGDIDKDMCMIKPYKTFM